MRISKAGLLVVLALLVPLLVEVRTVLSWVSIDLSVLETTVLGAVIVGAILVWAFLPDGKNGKSTDRDVSSEN